MLISSLVTFEYNSSYYHIDGHRCLTTYYYMFKMRVVTTPTRLFLLLGVITFRYGSRATLAISITALVLIILVLIAMTVSQIIRRYVDFL